MADKISVYSRDGKRYKIPSDKLNDTGPDGKPLWSLAYNTASAPSQQFGQGYVPGFNKIVSFGQALLDPVAYKRYPGQSFTERYNSWLRDNEAGSDAYLQDNPVKATGLRVAGAALQAAATGPKPNATLATNAKGVPSVLSNLATPNAVKGGTTASAYAMGESNKPDVAGTVQDAVPAALFGQVTGGMTGKAPQLPLQKVLPSPTGPMPVGTGQPVGFTLNPADLLRRFTDPARLRSGAADARYRSIRPIMSQSAQVEESFPGGRQGLGNYINNLKGQRAPTTGEFVAGPLDVADDLAAKLPAVDDAVGQRIGQTIDAADAAGGAFDIRRAISEAKKESVDPMLSNSNRGVPESGEKLRETLNRLLRKYGDVVPGVRATSEPSLVSGPVSRLEPRPPRVYSQAPQRPSTGIVGGTGDASLPRGTPSVPATPRPSGRIKLNEGWAGENRILGGVDDGSIPRATPGAAASSPVVTSRSVPLRTGQAIKNEMRQGVYDIEGNMDIGVPSYREGLRTAQGPVIRGMEEGVENALGPEAAAAYRSDKLMEQAVKRTLEIADRSASRGAGAANQGLPAVATLHDPLKVGLFGRLTGKALSAIAPLESYAASRAADALENPTTALQQFVTAPVRGGRAAAQSTEATAAPLAIEGSDIYEAASRRRKKKGSR